MISDLLQTSSAPWSDTTVGQVLWLPMDDAKVTEGVKTWAACPLWIDDLSIQEFPLSALLPLPDDIVRFLPNEFILSENEACTDAVLITEKGLFYHHQYLPWSIAKPWWPAIVAKAITIEANTYSPLMAMAIWLNRLPVESALPCYIPAKLNLDTMKTINPQQLHDACVSNLNSRYLDSRAATASASRHARKWRKLKTRPWDFVKDSKVVKKAFGFLK